MRKKRKQNNKNNNNKKKTLVAEKQDKHKSRGYFLAKRDESYKLLLFRLLVLLYFVI